ncbi:phosphotransferase [Sphingobium cupriresistens]|uniref:Aminoglycoside phosphotransferase n=1 Tax=Sphingobium cupriresistens LL01 TaxID=1420583 RepID=A0A0J7XMY4_9SPHN|nr:phosphotransferase [Sphingobium cupriresistens]KMS53002.1 aminoglycoside phosphotransferase [Sphingobium cupriresistens LL01]
MSGPVPLNEYDDAAVERITHFVEKLTGGKVVGLERLVRWRPSWFADVAIDGAVARLHLRGDRGGDVSIFPDLKREADVIDILHQHGLPVPQIHGYLADPPCIVMEAIAGTRDFSALDETTKSAIGCDYMHAIAAMHRLPIEPFVAAGLHRPEGAEAIALAGLDAYMPHYQRTKSRPEPLLAFVIGWLRRNVPRHRTQASFIQFDSGQYLVDQGAMTKLYDFEFSMIGDPLVDIATMGMRNSYEPLGAPLPELVRYYEEATGEPVDHDVVLFHVLQFSLLGTMQFAGTVGVPKPGDPHSVYLMFDLALRRSILLALSALSGVALPDLPPLAEQRGDNCPLMAKIADTLAGVPVSDEGAQMQKAQVAELIEWAQRADAHGADMVARNIADVSALLGESFDGWDAAAAALEGYASAVEPDQDAALIRLLGTIEGRRLQLFGPTALGAAASHVVLPATR